MSISKIAVILLIPIFGLQAAALNKCASSLQRGETLRLAAQKSQLNLFIAIESLEQAGAYGQWFKAVRPFDNGATEQYFYLLEGPPKSVHGASPFFLMRLEHSRSYLSAVLTKGHPLVIAGDLTYLSRAAMTLEGDFDLVKQVHRKSRSNEAPVLVTTLTTDKYTLAHEAQHAEDFQNPDFGKNFEQKLDHFVKKGLLTIKEVSDLLNVVCEVRGHARQEVEIKKDSLAKQPLIDRGGQTIFDYEFKVSQTINAFNTSHRLTLNKIIENLRQSNPSESSRLESLLISYDLAKEPLATISFKQLLKN